MVYDYVIVIAKIVNNNEIRRILNEPEFFTILYKLLICEAPPVNKLTHR